MGSETTPRKQYLRDTLGLILVWTHRDVIACPGWFKTDKIPALRRGGRLKITSNEEAIYLWCLLRKGKWVFLRKCYNSLLQDPCSWVVEQYQRLHVLCVGVSSSFFVTLCYFYAIVFVCLFWFLLKCVTCYQRKKVIPNLPSCEPWHR